MIIGIGTDITNIDRFEKLYEKYQDRFISRILTPFELIQFSKRKTKDSKLGFLAKRFAAKEAFSKALGTGFTDKVSFKDIYTYRDRNGRPGIEVSQSLNEYIQKLFGSGEYNFHLTLADDFPSAIAFVIIEKQ
ncbi:MAG: holo-ACP synthase [Rickettsiales bacterium]|jgi:holo-[acyl-carrier protein] synthase|nr:holo-ACP synthase [Rickettsiales bacterium]